VIDNKPGATGNIGTQAAARAAPDGHTLLMTSNPFTTNVSLFSRLPYDPVKSFTPIIDVGAGALALCVQPALPVKDVAAFVAYAKQHPGELNYGSPGVGGPHHLAMELFKRTAGIDLRHVPYRGSAGATQDIVGGHVAGGFLSLSLAAPLAKTGALRILGIASRERVPTSPDLPTLVEQGMAGFEAELWFGLMAPAGTPRTSSSATARRSTRSCTSRISPKRRRPRASSLAAARRSNSQHSWRATSRCGSRW
jgi:tripartite-type tricarboxylate transporter receptor subunit TctC